MMKDDNFDFTQYPDFLGDVDFDEELFLEEEDDDETIR